MSLVGVFGFSVLVAPGSVGKSGFPQFCPYPILFSHQGKRGKGKTLLPGVRHDAMSYESGEVTQIRDLKAIGRSDEGNPAKAGKERVLLFCFAESAVPTKETPS